MLESDLSPAQGVDLSLPLPSFSVGPVVAAPQRAPAFQPPSCVAMWGLRLACVTEDETVDMVDRLIEDRQPRLFITANLHWAMLSDRDPRLAEVNRDAAFTVADGMPMVWYSRALGKRLPMRVTGADLVYAIARRAAEKGHRVFLLGAAPGVAQQAAEKLCGMYPGLTIAGVESPALERLNDREIRELILRIRCARPDLMLAALGQPKGELWLHRHLQELDVPACVQVGATLDFVVGLSRRAPRWAQRVGLEWAWRIACEPARLGPRYWKNARFLATALWRDLRRQPWPHSV